MDSYIFHIRHPSSLLEQLVPANLRVRFWVEAVAACAAAVLGVVTLLWWDWIEAVFGVDPDHGNGSAEWIAVAGLFVLAGLLIVSAHSNGGARSPPRLRPAVPT
jgi:hypothetical protein